jgi:hypothetical protein
MQKATSHAASIVEDHLRKTDGTNYIEIQLGNTDIRDYVFHVYCGDDKDRLISKPLVHFLIVPFGYIQL